MMDESSSRPPLPHSGQSYTYALANMERREKQKNFVFVDEHNRHRRLKVTRACDGCRRRKIKCDAATTNTWPCSACIRLKMNCVPPTSDIEQEFSPEKEGVDQNINDSAASFHGSYATLGYDCGDNQPPIHRNPILKDFSNEYDFNRTDLAEFPHFATQAQSLHASHQKGLHLPPRSTESCHHPPVVSPSSHFYNGASTAFPGAPEPDITPEGDLLNALGTLKISSEAVAPYIADQKGLLEAPAMQEYEAPLPQQASHDLTVRIPSEMMPSEQQAMKYFQYFFTNVHPYVPVINRAYFYRQWQTDRVLISPLILEAIFACSSQMMGATTEASQWLALASRHEESFKDVSRLSTVQGLLLLLKAREAIPKRGYYYRSWMTVVHLVVMAKDLKLDQHFEIHQMGRSCGTTLSECVTKTRIWNTIFILELMIGAPQGRYDFGVRTHTVDFSAGQSVQGLEEAELRISQQFSHWMQCIKNVRESSMLMVNLRKKRADWALDPEFTRHSQDFDIWLRQLPRHLQISYPPDRSAPWIPFHFVANMHSYYYLCVIMHHRPQLESLSNSVDGSWKQEMLICYSSATKLCRLQEAILQNYGLAGLLCMQRGINFAIYAILTCTMLHLVALTSPDPELNHEAADYFSRHMRILERCSMSWPMQEMQMQIDSLRQAFSADTSKPFELRANFPHGSPGRSSQASSAGGGDLVSTKLDYQYSVASNPPIAYSLAPITPPSSSGTTIGEDNEVPSAQSLMTMGVSQGRPRYGETSHTSLLKPYDMSNSPPVQWNPTRIFDQWNTAFGTPLAAVATTQSDGHLPLSIPQSTYIPQQPLTSAYQTFSHATSTTPGHPLHMTQLQAQIPTHPTFVNPSPSQPYITPSMWQEAVASTYPDGLKRRWDHNPSELMDREHKRAR